MFRWDLRVPYQYRTRYVTLRDLHTILLEHYHPVYVRRFLAWLHYKNGYVGAGSLWRADGTQPDADGFAPEGKSFHQNQIYADGFVGACAVDTVITDGPDPGDWHDPIPWDQVPAQGTAEAARWGIHANVGVPGSYGSESWHIQPVEIDGWGSATGNGTHPAPALDPNYPIPPDHDPYRPEVPTVKPLFRLIQVRSDAAVYLVSGYLARWVQSPSELERVQAAFGVTGIESVERSDLAVLSLHGPQPQGQGVTTGYRDFHA